MDSHQLSEAQLDALFERLAPMAGYLSKLRARMYKRGFAPDDELLVLVDKAHDDMRHLAIHLHNASCGKLGRKPK
jgi:hypothetical protein